jgi:hypothetical protein
MPELSRFYGIVIAMFVERGGQHHLPHFHAFYQDYAASYSIATLELLEGELPLRQKRLVEAWAELHRQELAENWNSLHNFGPAKKIRPLR